MYHRLERDRIRSQPESRFGVIQSMIETADNLAGDYDITREAADAYALRSQQSTAAARAETIELQAQLNLERARLAGERDSAKARTESARLQLAAAERRAQLARESRGFFDKSFRLGETDLPTRLRIEAEAAEAERQAARARIELAAAISAWRQALGLLPQ